MQRGIIIRPNGSSNEVSVDISDSLEALYNLIGYGCDFVQMIRLRDGSEMWMDEEAKLRTPQAPVNARATKLLSEAGGMPGDVVLGNVVILIGDHHVTTL